MKKNIIQTSWFKKEKNPKLKLTRQLHQQKKWLKISWKTFKNSDIYVIKWEEILHIQSDETGKYTHHLKDFWVGEFDLEYFILDERGRFYHSKKNKNLLLTQEYYDSVQKNNQIIAKNKKPSYQKKTKKKITKSDFSEIQIIPQVAAKNIVADTVMKTSLAERLFQVCIYILWLLWVYILLRRYRIIW